MAAPIAALCRKTATEGESTWFQDSSNVNAGRLIRNGFPSLLTARGESRDDRLVWG
jgi:hypothetical protein